MRQHLLECFECDCMTPFPREQTAGAPIQYDVSNDSLINPELPTFTPKDDVQEQSLADPVPHPDVVYDQVETFKVTDSGTQRGQPCVA